MQQTAFMEKRQPMATLGLVQIGGGDDDGDAFLAQVVEDAPEVPARDRIDPSGGFVEQQSLGVWISAQVGPVSVSSRRTIVRLGGRGMASCRRPPAGARPVPRAMSAGMRKESA